jgi:hypothetical protein
LDEHNSFLKLQLRSSALILGFFACVCFGALTNGVSVQAFPMHGSFSAVYEEDHATTHTMDREIGRIIPEYISVSYGFSVPTGISVQQNVTQLNICSSNTAYCYNEVDNDFNVNPP